MLNYLKIVFLWSIPVFASLGHDLWVAMDEKRGGLAAGFFPAETGWIWTTYHKNSHDWVQNNIDPGLWETVMVPILTTPLTYILAVPLLVAIVVVTGSAIMESGGSQKAPKNKYNNSNAKKSRFNKRKPKGGSSSNAIDYKRK